MSFLQLPITELAVNTIVDVKRLSTKLLVSYFLDKFLLHPYAFNMHTSQF